MVATIANEGLQTLLVEREVMIAAPIEIAFEALLEQIGPENEGPPGQVMPMVLEAWPGGRWFRDLGNEAGHFWGHVQVIKPPKLLEICGPMFMSYPAMNHVQYRLSSEGTGTKLSFAHRGIGEIPAEHREGVKQGWAAILERIRVAAESR